MPLDVSVTGIPRLRITWKYFGQKPRKRIFLKYGRLWKSYVMEIKYLKATENHRNNEVMEIKLIVYKVTYTSWKCIKL